MVTWNHFIPFSDARALFGALPVSVCSGLHTPPGRLRLGGKLAINALRIAQFFPLVHWSFNFFEILLPSTEISLWRVWEVVYESQICIHMIMSFISRNSQIWRWPMNLKNLRLPSRAELLTPCIQFKFPSPYLTLTSVKCSTGHWSGMNKAEYLHIRAHHLQGSIHTLNSSR